MYRGRLPATTVRELIGLVRSLYFLWQQQDVSDDELDALITVGRNLRDALELSLKTKPNSAEHHGAWVKAERATAALCAMIQARDDAERDVAQTRRKQVGSGSEQRG